MFLFLFCCFGSCSSFSGGGGGGEEKGTVAEVCVTRGVRACVCVCTPVPRRDCGSVAGW